MFIFSPNKVNLVGLLKWRQQKAKIPDVLVSLAKVPGEEIVKVSFDEILQVVPSHAGCSIS